MRYAIAEYETHAEWTEHLDDLGMLDPRHVPCIRSYKCIAKDDDNA